MGHRDTPILSIFQSSLFCTGSWSYDFCQCNHISCKMLPFFDEFTGILELVRWISEVEVMILEKINWFCVDHLNPTVLASHVFLVLQSCFAFDALGDFTHLHPWSIALLLDGLQWIHTLFGIRQNLVFICLMFIFQHFFWTWFKYPPWKNLYKIDHLGVRFYIFKLNLPQETWLIHDSQEWCPCWSGGWATCWPGSLRAESVPLAADVDHGFLVECGGWCRVIWVWINTY